MSDHKTIFFIPDYILSATYLDKQKFIFALSNLLNTHMESIHDFENALVKTELNTISKRDLLVTMSSNKELLSTLSKFFTDGNVINNKICLTASRSSNIITYLTSGMLHETSEKYFTEMLSLYKGNIHNLEEIDYLKTYEVITDKDFICFVIKPGFSSCYENIEKYGQCIASSLIRFDPVNQKDYLNVLNKALF